MSIRSLFRKLLGNRLFVSRKIAGESRAIVFAHGRGYDDLNRLIVTTCVSYQPTQPP